MRPREEYRRLAVGKKIANEPLRVKVGEHSERIVARDPPAKGRYGLGGSSPTGEHRLKGTSKPRRSRRRHSSIPLSRCNWAPLSLTRKNAKNRPMRAGSNSENAARAGQNDAAE